MKKWLVISVLGVALAIFGVFIWYTSGVKVNGEQVAFVDKEEIKRELEQKGTTMLVLKGNYIDITSAVWKKAQDFEKTYGDQEVKVETGFDEDEVKLMIENSYTLGEFEAFDWDKIFGRIRVDEQEDISDCVYLIYDEDVIDLYHKCCDWSCEYKANKGWQNGKAVTKNNMAKYVKIKNNKVVFKDGWVDSLIKKLEKQWDNLGHTAKVKLFSRHKVQTIAGGNTTWGTLMDSAKEKEYILKQFHKGKPIKGRRPYLKQDYGSEIGKTRIEVSIANQTLWFYKKGKLVRTTSVVTGKTGHSTPRGIYYISERVPGKYLTGSGYKTWVNRWMRLTGQGVGLHDANWRSNFGGSIYVSSGSHGCVNLPSSFAYWLYPKTYVGMPVIVY